MTEELALRISSEPLICLEEDELDQVKTGDDRPVFSAILSEKNDYGSSMERNARAPLATVLLGTHKNISRDSRIDK